MSSTSSRKSRCHQYFHTGVCDNPQCSYQHIRPKSIDEVAAAFEDVPRVSPQPAKIHIYVRQKKSPPNALPKATAVTLYAICKEDMQEQYYAWKWNFYPQLQEFIQWLISQHQVLAQNLQDQVRDMEDPYGTVEEDAHARQGLQQVLAISNHLTSLFKFNQDSYECYLPMESPPPSESSDISQHGTWSSDSDS